MKKVIQYLFTTLFLVFSSAGMAASAPELEHEHVFAYSECGMLIAVIVVTREGADLYRPGDMLDPKTHALVMSKRAEAEKNGTLRARRKAMPQCPTI